VAADRGQPLFVQEVLRYLVEAGLVVREGDRYVRTDGGPDEAGIPEGLRDVIGKRLTRLSPETNQILAVAAVQGRDFRLDVLQAVANQPPEVVEQALEEAAERAIVEERTGLGTLAFRFTHAFFRQTLYEELFAARRLRLHQEVGRALEAAYGRRAEDHAAELAEHFAQSTDPADLGRALHYAEAAAERALAVYAYGDAARELDRALKLQEVLAPEDDAKRLELLLRLGNVLLGANEAERVFQEVADQAFRIAELGGDTERASEAFCQAFDALWAYGAVQMLEGEAASDWLERGRRVVHALSPAGIRADLASYYRAGPDIEARRSFLHRASESARSLGDLSSSWRVAGAGALWIGDPGFNEDAIREAEVAAALPRERVPIADLLVGLQGLQHLWLTRADRDRANAIVDEMLELASRTQHPLAQAMSAAAAAEIATVDGRLDDAAVAVEGFQIGDAGFVVAAVAALRPLTWLGRFPEQLASLRTFARCHGLASTGKLDEARELLPAAAGDLQHAFSVSHLVCETAVFLEDAQVVSNQLERLLAVTVPTSGHFFVSSWDRVRADAQAFLGRWQDARAGYELAHKVATKMGFRPEVALSRLGLAEVLLAHYPEERADALEHLDFAIEEFRAMKMRPALERALRHRELLKA